jgi:hypothetical protein
MAFRVDEAKARQLRARAQAAVKAAQLACQDAHAVVARIDAQTRAQRERTARLLATRNAAR